MSLSDWIIGSLLALLVIVGAVLTVTAEAQKAERGTQHWTVLVPETGPGQYVHVFDMSGVCLYLYEAHEHHGGGIVAIPKTQLAQGAGCQ